MRFALRIVTDSAEPDADPAEQKRVWLLLLRDRGREKHLERAGLHVVLIRFSVDRRIAGARPAARLA